MPTKGDIFVRECVIGFGFLGGLFAHVGVDPEGEILKALLEVVKSFLPSLGPVNFLLLFFFTVFFTILSILKAYGLGGVIGLVAVTFGWIGGFMIFGRSSNEVILGLIFLIIAIIIGQSATE